MHPDLKYRPDIDGLRAIAVIVVVLFHAELPFMTGGYVGVDVFFVLSGFLITSILLKDQSISRFYQRRVRRILPALFFMLAIVLIAGLFVLLPQDYVDLNNSAAATLFFGSNIWFWRQADYFATGTDLWPLLHTWSLGVEEQFYIAFPIIVKLVSRFKRNTIALVFAALAVSSFALAVFLMAMGKDTLTFYQSATRAWELLTGSLLATGVTPQLRSSRLRSVVAIAGLLAILAPVYYYDAGTSFPGIGALPPVLGTAAVIWAGTGGSHAAHRYLSWGPLVFIGLISYSLYLWHWPVLAGFRYVAVAPLSSWQVGTALVASILLAIFSWRFVEQPFRKPSYSNRRIWLTSATGAACLGLFVTAAFAGKGFPDRFEDRIVAINSGSSPTWRCGLTDFILFFDYYACPINLESGDANDADVIIWGDSHAQMYVPAIESALDERNGLLVVAYGCAPVLSEPFPGCGSVQLENFERIRSHPARTVIIGQNWPQYRDEAAGRLGRTPNPEERYLDGIRRLRELVTALLEAGKRVVIIGPVSIPGYDVSSVISRAMLFGQELDYKTAIPISEHFDEYANVLAAMEELDSLSNVVTVRVESELCGNEVCEFVSGSNALFADEGHLASDAARTLSPLFSEAFAKLDRN